MKNSRKIWLLTLGFLAADWLSKRVFYDLRRGEELRIFEPVFNTGISRGMQVYLPMVILISFLGIWLFFFLWKKKQLNDRVFLLFLAGTIWNLADRILLGGVRDFISIGNFPVFNLADCFLSLAVAILILQEIFPLHFKKK